MINSVLAQMRNDSLFQLYGVSLDRTPWNTAICDAGLYLRHDGMIVNAEGWYHPPGKLIGEVLYVPSTNGNKKFFGVNYDKITLYPGTYEPVPYSERAAELARHDPTTSTLYEHTQYFARYKPIFPQDEFVAAFLPKRTFAAGQAHNASHSLRTDLANLRLLLGDTLEGVDLGFTGAPALGRTSGYHDLDVVFYGTLVQNRAIAERMRQITRDSARRCFEGGKGWTIRFYNDHHNLMCCFFGYTNMTESPLHTFEMEVEEPDIEIEGTVVDDTHTMYTPSVVELSDVKIERSGGADLRAIGDKLSLIVYHTASRGDCYNGDRIRASGALVTLRTPDRPAYLALCVIDRDGLRNLTPAWDGYYAM